MTRAAPSVDVVIVNYRTGELVVDCLRALAAEMKGLPRARAIVVENASGDDSLKTVDGAIRREGWGSWARVLVQERNRGFGAGNNAWVRAALAAGDAPDFFLLLNPDTRVRPGAVRGLLDLASGDGRVGIAGPRLEHEDCRVQRSAFRFHSLLGELENGLGLGLASRLLARWVVAPEPPEEPARADWVSGACMLVRRRVFEDAGLFDESFFLYYEEVDFCRRAAAKGWQCWYYPSARVVHLCGRSTGVTAEDAPPARLPSYWFESRRRYFIKHHGLPYCMAADLAWIGGYCLWRIRAAVQRKTRRDPPRLLSDFVRNSPWAEGRPR